MKLSNRQKGQREKDPLSFLYHIHRIWREITVHIEEQTFKLGTLDGKLYLITAPGGGEGPCNGQFQGIGTRMRKDGVQEKKVATHPFLQCFECWGGLLRRCLLRGEGVEVVLYPRNSALG